VAVCCIAFWVLQQISCHPTNPCICSCALCLWSNFQLTTVSVGWGIGSQRELTPAEFAKKGDRSYFEGYQTKQQGDFINQIRQDREELKKSQLKELLGVAKIAGINIKDPSQRLDKFEVDVMEKEDDEDDLDLSV
jgi:hypothetical protein